MEGLNEKIKAQYHKLMSGNYQSLSEFEISYLKTNQQKKIQENHQNAKKNSKKNYKILRNIKYHQLRTNLCSQTRQGIAVDDIPSPYLLYQLGICFVQLNFWLYRQH